MWSCYLQELEVTTDVKIPIPSGLSDREILLHLQDTLPKHFPKIDIKMEHHFSKGVYAREAVIPAGAIVVGKIHKHENLNIVSKGDISVFTEEGWKRIKAPATFVSPPGVKRLGLAHEDTVWTCIHATEETDLEKIESEMIAVDYEEFDQLSGGKKCLGSQSE